MLTRREGRPPFLTDRDFAEHRLECQLAANKHAVYALTICIPKEIYQEMLLDEEIGNWEIVKRAVPDGDRMFLPSKIGETTNLPKRISHYKVKRSRNSMYRYFLRKRVGKNM